MSSLSPKDRVSLCSFTFSDGRRCRTPRTGKHPRFCFYHAQKEARARAAQNLGKDLAYFFSGDYLSACDLSTALGRLIPAVVRGDVKPKTAHTVAYLAQTLMQAIHLSKHEYINAFGSDGWRQSVRNSVNGNHDYLFPPAPKPEPPPDQAPPVVAGLHRLRKKSLSSLKSAVMLSLSALLAWRFLGLCQTVSFTTWIGRLPSVGASRFSRGEQFLQPDQIRCGGV